MDGKGLSLEISVDVSVGASIQAENEGFSDRASSEGIEEDIESVCFNCLGILGLPVTLSNYDVLGTFGLEENCVLFSTDDVEEGNSQSDAELVEHSSE